MKCDSGAALIRQGAHANTPGLKQTRHDPANCRQILPVFRPIVLRLPAERAGQFVLPSGSMTIRLAHSCAVVVFENTCSSPFGTLSPP